MTAHLFGYTFEGLYTSTSLIKNISGVYVIADCTSHGNSLLDVGESGTLKDRLDSHDRAECWERHRKGTLKVAVFYANELTRRNIADDIRSKGRPTCGVR